MSLRDLLLSLVILASGVAACFVWERAALRAAAHRRDRTEAAALDERLHPGDDCGLALILDDPTTEDQDLGVELEPPFPPERTAVPGQPLPPLPDECYPADAVELDPLPTLREEEIEVPRERLYDAGGLVRLGRHVLHDHCLFLRREGRFDEICGDCRPSIVGSAAEYPS